MAKLVILAAMALFLVAATASVTITTIEVDGDSNPSRTQQCYRQLQGQPLRSCQRFLTEGCQCGCQDCQCKSRRRGGRLMIEGESCRLQKTQCCQELERMDEQCRCEGIKKIVQQLQQQEESYQGEDMDEMVQQAKKLPSVCGFEPRRCSIRTVWF